MGKNMIVEPSLANLEGDELKSEKTKSKETENKKMEEYLDNNYLRETDSVNGEEQPKQTKTINGKLWILVKKERIGYTKTYNQHKKYDKDFKNFLEKNFKDKGFNIKTIHKNDLIEGWVSIPKLPKKTNRICIKELLGDIQQNKNNNSQIDYLIKNFDKLIKFFNKKGFHEIDNIIEDILIKLKMKEMSNGYGFVILSGIGGSGKSKIAEVIFEFLKLNLKREFSYISTDDSTTTENLLCRVGLKNGSEIKKYGIMGDSLNNNKNILFDEFNRTEFRNVQKLMSLFAGGTCDSEGIYFKIPSDIIIIGTCNLGSIGTYPIAEEFKQRCGIIEVKYKRNSYEIILNNIFKENILNEIAMEFYDKSIDYTIENKHGWRNELSVRSLVDFINEIKSGISIKGYKKENITDTINKAVKSIVLQFINENNPYDLKESSTTIEEISKELNNLLSEKIKVVGDGNNGN